MADAQPSAATRVIVIGCGARMHSLLDGILFAHARHVRVAAIADSAAALLPALGAEFECPTYTDADAALDAHPDAPFVLIGSSNERHAREAIAAFRRGRHVICEKPIATSVADCVALLREQRAAERVFVTGFVLRHAPLYCAIKDVLARGDIGRIVSVEANELLSPDHGSYIMRNWRRSQEQSGGHLLEKCCHDIDILNWLIGDLPTKVASFGGKNVFVPENKALGDELMRRNAPAGEHEPELYYGWPAWEELNPFTSGSTIVDNQVCILQYRKGVRATFHTNMHSALAQRRLEIVGLEGMLEADLWEGTIKLRRVSRGQPKTEIIDSHASGSGHGDGDRYQIAEWVNVIRGQAEPKATGLEGIKSAVVCIGLEEAMQRSQVVDLEPYWEQIGV